MALNWVTKCIQKPSRVPGCAQDAAQAGADRGEGHPRAAQAPALGGVVDDDRDRDRDHDADRAAIR